MRQERDEPFLQGQAERLMNGKLGCVCPLQDIQGLGLLLREFHILPGQPAFVEFLHEGVRIILFHVENACAGPFAREDHFRTDHGGYSGGVGDGLGAYFFKALFMITDVIDIDGFELTMFDSCDDVADAGFSFGAFAQISGVRKDCLEKLQRDDFHSVVSDGVNAGHSYVLQYFQMFEVVGREGHPELGAADGGDVLHEAFHFFMVHAVDFIGAYLLGAGEALVHAHGRGFLKFPVFPVAAGRGDFTDIDFRVEVGSKGFAVVAPVDVNDVQRVNFIKMVFERPGGEYVGDAGVKAGAQQGKEARLTEFFLIGPLP